VIQLQRSLGALPPLSADVGVCVIKMLAAYLGALRAPADGRAAAGVDSGPPGTLLSTT